MNGQRLGSHKLPKFNFKHSCRVRAVNRKQLKGHHTVYKPAGWSHPDFALPDPFRAIIRGVFIDDVLRAEALIRIRLGMVSNGVDGLRHIAVWLGSPTENLPPCCSDKLNKVVLWKAFEGSSKIEVASIKQFW